MKQLLLICAAVALVGCGEAEQEAAPMAQAHAEELLTYEDSEEAKAAAEAKVAHAWHIAIGVIDEGCC